MPCRAPEVETVADGPQRVCLTTQRKAKFYLSTYKGSWRRDAGSSWIEAAALGRLTPGRSFAP